MTITIFRQSATMPGLKHRGAVARPITQPPCKLTGIRVDLEGAGNNRTGVWECEPGRYEREMATAEFMHILKGKATFTPTGGESLEIEAGDTLFFPSNTFGEWHILEPLRKVYVVMVI